MSCEDIEPRAEAPAAPAAPARRPWRAVFRRTRGEATIEFHVEAEHWREAVALAWRELVSKYPHGLAVRMWHFYYAHPVVK